jgi:hypothetical protein
MWYCCTIQLEILRMSGFEDVEQWPHWAEQEEDAVACAFSQAIKTIAALGVRTPGEPFAYMTVELRGPFLDLPADLVDIATTETMPIVDDVLNIIPEECSRALVEGGKKVCEVHLFPGRDIDRKAQGAKQRKGARRG